MYIRVRTTDGKKFHKFQVSKASKMSDLKRNIADVFDVSPQKQRLFFGGKQLENSYTLFDYGINLNDVIQLMVIENLDSGSERKCDTQSNSVNGTTSASLPKPHDTEENDTITASKYYKVGDLIDAKDYFYGAWFEAEILSIQKKTDLECAEDSTEDGCLYRVKFFGALESHDAVLVPLKDIRPRARHYIPVSELTEGDVVMVNYNTEEHEKRGYWYDCVIKKVNRKSVIGDVTVGVNDVILPDCKIVLINEIMKIESHRLLTDRTEDESHQIEKEGLRLTGVYCEHCKDDENKKCKECNCRECGGKNNPEKQIMCDECNTAYHIWCLSPPLDDIPDMDEWYCPKCKNDENEVVKAGEKLKDRKNRSKMPSNSSTRDWGRGMACVGRTKQCTIVPANHYGPVPGIEVGTSWKFRLQVSEAGIHRPVVAGIHGRESDGAYSIALSGGYEDDVDNGNEFIYTGSGGRDLSGNKRTSIQSADQTLTRLNKALALNCNAPLNQNGAEAKNWRDGKPVRVVRNYKLAKHSIYAPTEGNRYDGIYKVVKYYKEKGRSGFYVWRYLLRRDDPAPAPWTEKGKKRMQSLDLNIIYPEGYLETNENENLEQKSSAKKRMSKRTIDIEDYETEQGSVKKPALNVIDKKLMELIMKDTRNKKLWDTCLQEVENEGKKLINIVEDKFMCICCQEVLYKPVTTECGHNICAECLERSFSAGLYTCPYCRHDLTKGCKVKINSELNSVLLALFPGYDVGR